MLIFLGLHSNTKTLQELYMNFIESDSYFQLETHTHKKKSLALHRRAWWEVMYPLSMRQLSTQDLLLQHWRCLYVTMRPQFALRSPFSILNCLCRVNKRLYKISFFSLSLQSTEIFLTHWSTFYKQPARESKVKLLVWITKIQTKFKVVASLKFFSEVKRNIIKLKK